LIASQSNQWPYDLSACEQTELNPDLDTRLEACQVAAVSAASIVDPGLRPKLMIFEHGVVEQNSNR
jgi:hypothetical protein